jgi:hypothetical protein
VADGAAECRKHLVVEPNRILEVTPDFLEAVLDQVLDAVLDVISLDEAVERLREGSDKRFACFSPSTTVTATTSNTPIRCSRSVAYRSPFMGRPTTRMGTASCGGSRWRRSSRGIRASRSEPG